MLSRRRSRCARRYGERRGTAAASQIPFRSEGRWVDFERAVALTIVEADERAMGAAAAPPHFMDSFAA